MNSQNPSTPGRAWPNNCHKSIIMNLLILGRPKFYWESPDSVFRNYRGTERFAPCFDIEFDEDHPVNRVFSNYTEILCVDEGFIRDIQEAREIVEKYGNLDEPEFCEIIAVTEGNDLAKF
jgi:hypothetical protein